MKIRMGFVSNSSSSSFTIDSKELNTSQLIAVLNPDYKGFSEYFEEQDSWRIYMDEFGIIEGFTFMDNFPMTEYLKYLEIPNEIISWHY